MKSVVTAALAASVMFAVAGQANAAVFATNVVASNPGAGGPGLRPARNNTDPTNALGAQDSKFYSLGLGGFLLVDFLPASFMNANVATVFEITTVCTGVNAACDNFPESVAVYYGSGLGNLATANDILTTFTFAGEIGNNAAQSGGSVFAFGAFDQIALFDTTNTNFSTSTSVTGPDADGFDVDAVHIAPIPVPAALPLLASAFGLVVLFRRRAAIAA